MSDTLEAPPFHPPHPKPRTEPLGMVAFLRAVRENPLNTWMEAHFEESIITGEGALGRMTVVNDPAVIRHILVDNAANYRKDDLQIRILAPGLGRGLVTAEGDEWRLQRRTIAPLFTPRHVGSFFPAMVEAADRLVRRWRRRPDGRVVDAALAAKALDGEVREDLVHVHVGLGARARLIDHERKLIVILALHHIGGRRRDGIGQARLQLAKILVHKSGGLLHDRQRMDQGKRHPVRPDAEVLERTLRLGAPELVGCNFDGAEGICFNAG
jgi:hypothetical protein